MFQPDRPQGEMAGTDLTVVAAFDNQAGAGRAVAELRAAGFDERDIEILSRDFNGSTDVTKDEERYFNSRRKAGAVLLAIDVRERMAEVRGILLDLGADLGPNYGRGIDRSIDAVPGDYIGTEMADHGNATVRNITNFDDADLEDEEHAVMSASPDSRASAELWRGNERRVKFDTSYQGPERRHMLSA